MKIGKMIQFLLLGVIAVGFMGANGCKGTLKGTVTNSLTKAGVEGVTVTLDPAVEGVTTTTDASGAYTASIPEGDYKLTFTKKNYTNGTGTATIKWTQPATADAVLVPTANVVVSMTPASQEGTFGGTASVQVSVDILDGSTLSGVLPEQTGGPTATLTNITQGGFTVQLASYELAKASLITALKEPDRFMISGINPYSLAAGKEVALKVTATTSSGKYPATAVIELPLELSVSTGLPNVPTNVPVLLHGKGDTFSWSIFTPSGSKAALEDPTSANPYFTPDVKGEYTITEADSKTELKVYAGSWSGGITGQDASGNPIMGNCTVCHSSPATFSDKFETWSASGHAHIFSQNITTPNNHYSESCLPCHTVGFDLTAANNGADDQSDYQAFVDSGLMHTSEVCGSCHGEPARHGRYQQWQESGHGNFEVAGAEGTNGSCAVCHSGQGFLYWGTLKYDATKATMTADQLKAAGITAGTVQPQTCQTCHDPHDVGTTSGDANDATVRVTGDSPKLQAGYVATGLGRGAICVVCHNQRRGLHNDANVPTSYSGPHEPTQADILMGQSVYFVTVGQRSKHADVKDSCAGCHMDKTPPPADLSYQLGGTNHTFKAAIDICSQCHSTAIPDATGIQSAFDTAMTSLEEGIETAAIAKLNGLGTIKVRAYDPATDLYSTGTATVTDTTIDTKANPIKEIEITPAIHGQMSFYLTLTTPISISWVSATGADTGTTTTAKFGVQLQALQDGTGALVYAKTSNMVKAFWNFLLLEQDLSKGV
ncbi:MAG: carboxypeptidase regulatory-like domain-containing protein, partial [Proteobacteria bacterium]|nr:carboxypeptidase regulatory-like domain-containing protein [Pseudomonadota bacterium]